MTLLYRLRQRSWNYEDCAYASRKQRVSSWITVDSHGAALMLTNLDCRWPAGRSKSQVGRNSNKHPGATYCLIPLSRNTMKHECTVCSIDARVDLAITLLLLSHCSLIIRSGYILSRDSRSTHPVIDAGVRYPDLCSAIQLA